MILAGDIGGTKTTLALYNKDEGCFKPLRSQTFASREHPDFFSVIDTFLTGPRALLSSGENRNQTIKNACFGIAGPIFNQQCTATNLPWIIDAQQISRRYTITKVHLLNDLEAMAYGTLTLPKTASVRLNTETGLQTAAAPPGNRAVIAAGTGLGEALLYWDGAAYHPSASEGGHSDFAPRNPTEIALLEYLLKRHSRVSYERVLSGPGLFTLYEFMKQRGHGGESPWLTERLVSEDPAAVISEAALAEQSDLCVHTLDLFVSLLGAEAGNLALKYLATGGVYLGGGIAPKILCKLKDGTFMKAFLHKGRFSSLLEKIPVWVILDPQTALHGAAQFALSNDPDKHIPRPA